MPEGAPLTPEAQFPLKNWFNNMEEENRRVIESEIFNTRSNFDLDKALNEIQDQEVARGIMLRFRNYLELKKSQAPRDVIKSEAEEIAQYVDRIILPE